MSKYINADELNEKLSDEENCYPTDDYFEGYVDGIIFCHHLLDEMPSADVVEVVRCKDCKYSESIPKGEEWNGFKLGCMFHREYTKATDFCSQAERKETNG